MKLPDNRAVLAIAFVVIASGCTDTGGGSGSDVSVAQEKGVVIDSFTAFPSETPERTPVTLELSLENRGASKAKNIKWSIGNIPLNGNRNWKLGSPLQQGFTLRAPDPETGTQGGVLTRSPSLKSPNLGQGTSIDYTINTEVSYNYTTRGTTEVTLISRKERRESGATASEVTLDNTGGPVQLQTSTRNPIVYYDSGSSGAQVRNPRFCVTAENVGSGETVDGGIELAVQTSGTLKVGVSPDGGRTEAQASSNPQWTNNARTTVDFTTGRTEARNCFYLNIPDREQVSNKLTLPVTVEASYRYKIEDSTQVTVNGREGGSDNTDSSVGGGSTNSEVQDGGYAWKSPSSLESKYSGNTLTQKKKSLASAKESFDPDNYCTVGTTTSTQKSDYCREVG